MINFKKFNNIISLTSYYNSDEKCKQAITEARWGVGNSQDVVCPYCGKYYCKMSKNRRYHCTGCNKNFSCLVGTIFENTKLPLIKWFVGMYLISSHKKGVSSHQLARDIEVTQSTAWYMLQKIRLLYVQTDADAFEGTVECDEVYIGSKEKWKHKSMRTPNTQGLATLGYTNAFVNHSAEEYADGDIFTNSIEGFWSHFRRMITGCYHDVSDEHLQKYIDEVVYRWNTRKMSESERFAHMFDKSIGLVKKWSEIKVGFMAA